MNRRQSSPLAQARKLVAILERLDQPLKEDFDFNCVVCAFTTKSEKESDKHLEKNEDHFTVRRLS